MSIFILFIVSNNTMAMGFNFEGIDALFYIFGALAFIFFSTF